MLSAGFLIQKIMRRGLISDLHHSQSKLISKKPKRAKATQNFQGQTAFKKAKFELLGLSEGQLATLGLGQNISQQAVVRSFSAIRCIRNWLRSSTALNRFSALAILHTESELTANLDSEKLVGLVLVPQNV